jgi:hypothetical protein
MDVLRRFVSTPSVFHELIQILSERSEALL